MERRLAAILAADIVGYSRLMRADEEGTLARLKALRKELFAPKVREHHGRIYSLAYRYTRDRELALDVLQETFIYVLGKFPGFELRAQMKTFLYPTVRHLSIALQSKTTRRPPPTSGPLFEPAPDPADDERSRGLAELMEGLPVGQREVLILRYADELSLAEIAESLQIPLGTVKSRLHGAIEAMRADERARKCFDP